MRYQVHHSYIWLGSLRASFVILFAVICSSLSAIPGLIVAGPAAFAGISIVLIALLAFVVLFAVILGVLLLVRRVAYKHLWYELGEEEFSLYSGIFNKKRTHVPYRRVQSVDQRTSLLQRIFGVCTVYIDTAGGSANKAAVVPYITKAQAEGLRRELFARKRIQEHAPGAESQRNCSGLATGQAAATAGVAAAASGAVVPAAGAVVLGSPVPSPSAQGVMPVAGQVATPPASQAAPAGNVLDLPAEAWDEVRGLFAGDEVDTGRVTYEYGLTNKELALTGLSNNTAFILIVLGILGAIAQFVGDMAPVVSNVVDPTIGNVVVEGAHLFGGSLIALGVAVVVGVAFVTWALSAAATCLSYGGFRARRRDNRIEVERGLLQHTFQGVDVDRVQSVTVKQSFIRRLMGYCEISVGKIDADAQGSADQQKSSLSTQGVIVHPFVKTSRVPEILSGLLPEFADMPTSDTPVAPVALRRALIRRCIVQGSGFWLAVFATAVFAFLPFALNPADAFESTLLAYLPATRWVVYALAVALLVFDGVDAVLWFRGSSFAFNRRFMRVSNAGFSRETTSFPRGKIQFGAVKSNPFQRRAHTLTLCIRTAAGVGGGTVRLIDACEEDANEWLNWVKPHGLPRENVLE